MSTIRYAIPHMQTSFDALRLQSAANISQALIPLEGSKVQVTSGLAFLICSVLTDPSTLSTFASLHPSPQKCMLTHQPRFELSQVALGSRLSAARCLGEHYSIPDSFNAPVIFH
ncbi:hypothetical protein PCANC_00984 [Puccinia coronata f. sp. avenae]|uniref:Uncharacterized protein n=1 Tax=Puccinia coronata f. sp. avenae TaxID=200324 RepID=A0A2N5W6I2_9BASI|nr:hypothetical protein PCANC_00984 [Puccinia coronata f. sp. avenae]